MILYYITKLETIKSIKENGIKADQGGKIALFGLLEVLPYAAIKQFNLDQYGVFEVLLDGISGRKERNVEYEKVTKNQIVVFQDLILPEYINYFGTFNTEEALSVTLQYMLEHSPDFYEQVKKRIKE